MRPANGHSDLIRLIQEIRLGVGRPGADHSLNEICARLRPELLQQCHGRLHERLRTKTSESDIVQEALLSVSQSFATFRGQTAEELLAWASRILDNKSLEFQRRFLGTDKRNIRLEEPLASEHSTQHGVVLQVEAVSPLEKLVSAEDALRVQQLISQLSEHYREVVRLRHLEDLGFADIARRLQRTEPSVKNIYVRAMEILEQGLQEEQVSWQPSQKRD